MHMAKRQASATAHMKITKGQATKIMQVNVPGIALMPGVAVTIGTASQVKMFRAH